MPTELIASVFGMLLGAVGTGVLVWLLAMARERQLRDTIMDLRDERSAAETRVEVLQHNLAQSTTECDRARGEVRRYERAWTENAARLNEAKKNLKEQQSLVEKAKETLSHQFQALASQALARNNQGFLELAEQRFKSLRACWENI